MHSKSKTIMPVITDQVRMIASTTLVFVSLVAAFGHKPYLFLTLFFVYQVAMMFLTKDHFTEWLFVAPAKVALALVMVMSGIPDNSAGLFWIGISMLVLASGIRDFKRIRHLWLPVTHNPVIVTTQGTARQRTKEVKAEEYLFADLTDFLRDSDSNGEDK